MSELPDLPPAPEVVGVSLDGDEKFVVDADENAALCRSSGVEPAADGTAHPVYYFIATQVGMGRTVEGLCAACDFAVEDGPMMGSSTVRFARAIRVGEPYAVRGAIMGLVRKRSRKLGVMDVLDYRLGLYDADGALVLETDNVWMLPRKDLA